MKHTVMITALNCAFGGALTDMSTFYEEEFDSSTSRIVLFKNEYESYFKMKSTSATAYIEPCFYGLRNGDVIEIEFEACCIEGQTKIKTLQVDYTPPSTTNERTSNTTSDYIPSYFKKYKTKIALRKLGNSKGVVINIRPTNASIVIIKNVTITIDTTNPKFGLVENNVRFENESDILACVNYYSQTKKKTAYNTLKAIASNQSEVSIIGDEFKSIGTNTNSFKGLMSMMPVHDGMGTLAVCLESISPTGMFITVQGFNNTTATTLSQKSLNNSFLKKKIYYIQIKDLFDFLFMDVGAISSNKYTIKNLVFNMTHFNDSTKTIPNKLEDLDCI